MLSEFVTKLPLLDTGVIISHMQDQLLQFYLAGTDPHVRKFAVTVQPPRTVIPSSAVTCVVFSVPRVQFRCMLERYPELEVELNHRANLFLGIHLITGKPEESERRLLGSVQRGPNVLLGGIWEDHGNGRRQELDHRSRSERVEWFF